MEIHLDKRAVRQIRVSAADAIEEGDTDALRDDILEAFSEAQIEEIEQRLGASDFYELLTDLMEEWSGDDVDELFELLETHLGEHGIDLKYHAPDEEEEEDLEEDFDDYDELLKDKDEDEDEDEDEELTEEGREE
jgi:hypothetical protein